MKTRPSKYTPELVAKAKHYLENWHTPEIGDVIPMLCSLACYIDVDKKTLERWEKEEGDEKQEICLVCARVRELQEKVLINKGLSRVSDASLSKLLLMKHGYSDRIEQDVKSSDGSMSPTEDARKEAQKRIKDEFGSN
jgi:DNA-binding XRE family transcriptional regulator